MRLKVTHITVGMYHEVCFVCSAAEEAYFRTVMQALEEEHALKSCLYVYDRDPFEGAIKRRLSHCYFVLFAITPSIVKRALADENDAFRRVYGYVNRVNQSAVSLMSVGGSDYDKTNFRGPCALIFGSEGDGVSALLKERCDGIVSIPMKGKVNSFNVSTAAAILLAEAARQHRVAAMEQGAQE